MSATANSTSWRVRYPRRSPHPPRTRIRLDAVERAAATGSNVLFSFGAPVSLDEKPTPSASRHCPQQAGRNTDSAITYGEAEDNVSSSRGIDTRAVRFDSVVKIILVPTRSDLGGLSEDLWWRREDYLQFRLGAIVDGSTEVLRRTLGQRRLRRSMEESTPTTERFYAHLSEVAQALQPVDHPRGGARPAPQHLKVRLPSPGRDQPPTPPTSPVNENSTEGVAKENRVPVEEVVASSTRALSKDEWSYVEDFDGFVGLGGLPS